MGGVRPNASENGQISPSTTVRAVRGDGSCPKLASILPEGRKTANICPNSGVIRGIPVQAIVVAHDLVRKSVPTFRDHAAQDFIPAGATCEVFSPISSNAWRTRPEAFASSMNAVT